LHNIKKGKRELIINSAVKVFSEKGFHGATVKDIANHACIGKGTIYEYFDSKKDLFEEMIMQGLNIFADKARDELEGCNDVRGRLRNFIMLTYKFIKTHRDMACLLSRDPNTISAEMKNTFMKTRFRMQDIVEDIIEEGISKGIFRQMDAHLAGLVFQGMIGQLGADMMFGRKDLSEEAVDNILDIFYNGTLLKTAE